MPRINWNMVFIWLFLLCTITPSPGQASQQSIDRKLIQEIIAAFKFGGENGLTEIIRAKKDRITPQIILTFANSATMQKREDYLRISFYLSRAIKNPETIAAVFLNAGEYYTKVPDLHKAAKNFEKAALLYSTLNAPKYLAYSYYCAGDIYSMLGRNEDALKFLTKAHEIYSKAKIILGQGEACKRIGDVLMLTGNYDEAMKMFKKSHIYCEQGNSPLGRANAYMGEGEIYRMQAKHDSALQVFNKALDLYTVTGSDLGMGNALKCIGDVYKQKSNIKEALEKWGMALEHYKKAGDFVGLANIYSDQAKLLLISGNITQAHEMCDKALEVLSKFDDLLGLGNMYNIKGDIYSSTGQNARAIEMYQKALISYSQFNSPMGKGNIYKKKGNIYLWTGNYEYALDMYLKAAQNFKVIDEPYGFGNVCLSIGAILSEQGKYEKAKVFLENALSKFKSIENHIGTADAYLHLGGYYFYKGDKQNAMSMYNKAMEFHIKAGHKSGQAAVYFFKGHYYQDAGNLNKAYQMFQNSGEILEEIEDISGQAHTLGEMAFILEQLNDLEKAKTYYKKSIDLFEETRQKTCFLNLKKDFMKKVYKHYVNAALFMLKSGDGELSFQYIESLRARVFLDQLSQGLTNPGKGIPAKMKAEHDGLTARLSLISKQIARSTSGNEQNGLRKEYRNVEKEYQELLIKIKLENHLPFSLKDPVPVSVSEIQNNCLKKGETLVSYFLSNNTVHAFVISSKDFIPVRIRSSKNEIIHYIDSYQEAVKAKNGAKFRRYARLLYRSLFKPVEKELAEAKRLTIIPFGKLATVSFDSFITGKKQNGTLEFLMEKYSIKYIQSASILSILRRHYKENKANKVFAGFGDPDYGSKNGNHKNPSKRRQPILAPAFSTKVRDALRDRFERLGYKSRPLPGSKDEIEGIAELFQKNNHRTRLFLGINASEENLKHTEMKNYSYIHLACHGLVNSQFQCLVLSQGIPGAKEDGYLTLNEIMNCNLNADLVVLSACRTGSGKMEKGEGITGLTRAIMYAGTPSVIVTLWNVDDQAAKELMITFYKNLLEKNMSKAYALREARLTVLQSGNYASPYFWSAFVIYGD